MAENGEILRVVMAAVVYVAGPFAIIALYQRFKFLSKVGTIVMAYLLGILMSFTGLAETGQETVGPLADLKTVLQGICVPLAIPLMLFSADFRAWMKSLKSTFIAFFCGVAAIVLSVTISYMLFDNGKIAELDKAAGLMMGFYTGGTPNVASLKMALQPSSETFLLVNTFEIFITFFLLAFLIAGGYKLVRRFLVYKPDSAFSQDRREETSPAAPSLVSERDFEDYRGLFSGKSMKALLLPFSCSVLLFVVAGLASYLWVGADYRVVSVVLIITTLSIVLSFWKKLRQTPKMFELGMYFILVFSTVIASDFQISKVTEGSTYGLMGFIAVVLSLGVLLHLLLAKICKVDADLFTISAVGLIFSPPFVPAVAGLMQSRRCLLSGIVVGLLGYAVGNYLGVAVYMLVRFI